MDTLWGYTQIKQTKLDLKELKRVESGVSTLMAVHLTVPC